MVGSVCKLFAVDCKLYSYIESEADMKELQEDIERLCKWSRDWLLGFNIMKCKVISFGNIHFEIEYSLTDSENNSRTNQYFNFFLPSTIRDWNSLNKEQRNSTSVASFKHTLNQMYLWLSTSLSVIHIRQYCIHAFVTYVVP